MTAIQFRHFNSLQNIVSPVEVPTHPVHSKALCYSHSTVKYLSKRDSGENDTYVKLWMNAYF